MVDRVKKCEGAIAQMLVEIENKKALIREIVTLTYETNPSLGETLTQFLFLLDLLLNLFIKL